MGLFDFLRAESTERKQCALDLIPETAKICKETNKKVKDIEIKIKELIELTEKSLKDTGCKC